MKFCAIIPSYNHAEAIAGVVMQLQQAGFPIFIIDDGNNLPIKEQLAALSNEKYNVFVHRLQVNQGKGGAVMKGFELAIANGFTHAIQIDADGQHDLATLPQFIEISQKHPKALVSGQPIYDNSIPKARKIGRWLTHIWVWIETWSFQISDSMCGFRVYPLAAVRELLSKEVVGKRMDFDTDIMVRMFWRGTPVIMQPVKVIYPPNNNSNFDMLRDNWFITKMHTKLVLTMLWRLLFQPPEKTHWANIKERGAYFGLKFCVLSYQLFGRKACLIIISPIVFYFYVTGKKQRLASIEFLSKALGHSASFMEGYRHFMEFAKKILDGFISWVGKIPEDKIIHTHESCCLEMLNDPRGALIIVSHLGNNELARGSMDKAEQERMLTLVHSHNAKNYQNILQKIQPSAMMNLLEVTDIGVETIIMLQEHIQKGAIISIAGDRIPVSGKKHISKVPFLGSDAAFPHGALIIASLLKCPVYLLFCLPKNGKYHLTIERFAQQIDLPHKQRQEALNRYIARYAERLEHYAKSAPFQWFNFFPFWE